mmetsp:Transcript_19114/g.22012  ORF Transcript_19114/g.22012 Transcript_19114/m.22012 type:complete len:83 (-) Transcript_19114:2032-2280(-)
MPFFAMQYFHPSCTFHIVGQVVYKYTSSSLPTPQNANEENQKAAVFFKSYNFGFVYHDQKKRRDLVKQKGYCKAVSCFMHTM